MEIRQGKVEDLLPTLVAGDTIIAGFDREEYESLPVESSLKRLR